MSEPAPTTITSVQQEHRAFVPEPAWSAGAHIDSMETYRALRDQAASDPDGYWGARGREELHWETPFATVLDWQPPNAQWYVGGRTNLAFNCLDRHLDAHGDRVAIHFEGEAGDRRTLTYRELHAAVCRCANALRSLGVRAGDRVGIYLPLIPEATIAMLACARIGAVHSVVYAGFSADALRDRMLDAGARVLITADAGWRTGTPTPLKATADEAIAQVPTIEHVIVVHRAGDGGLTQPRDVAWDALMSGQSDDAAVEWVDSEHPLFILYTSGSTGKPKGVLHTTAGYGVNASLTTRWVFDLRAGDVYWCTADVGWVTGHTYGVYGPLLNAATTVMYEGTPLYPRMDRFWEIIARYSVTIFYTAPTAIRAFMRLGPMWPRRHDLSSLRVLGSVGEPINPEAWMWYRDVIGGGRCPVVDTWWQTETGAIMVSPFPGATPTKPGSATLPLPGIDIQVLDPNGEPVKPGQGGLLYIGRPWPSMLRTLWGNQQRFVETYFGDGARFVTGDGARVDEDGYLWILGRVDDVVNVAGHRLGTAEIESALVSHPAVSEAAVVGRSDPLKGTALVAFVTTRAGVTTDDDLRTALGEHVAREIGALARPSEIRFADALPKTRSGKIMRRLLRDVAENREASGDVTTLDDRDVLERLRVEE